MKHQKLETDYLIVGSGAVGMAFADVLLSETNANIIIVDKYHKPGGHWNVAYPFVTLHQPSAFYGVSSWELSQDRKDQVGLNKGFHDLASGAEVSAYFDSVMRHEFLPTGRVQYFPMCEYKRDYKFASMLTGEQYEVTVNKKLVDATYLKTSVPATHTPNFTFDDGVKFMPLNDLTKIKTPPTGFVVIGGGKTGMDAIIWLLENKVDPDNITWIVSRDAWLLDRANTQPSLEFFNSTLGAQALQFEALAAAESIDDLFERLESSGVLIRLDKNIKPQMFHGATVSQMELAELRKIRNIVRKGRVKHIHHNKIILDKGDVATKDGLIYVDCSASAIENLEIVPIFQNENTIIPQTVRSYQPVFSAAFIAHIEANETYPGDKGKNKICQVVPLPNHDTDWIRMLTVMMMNQFNWSQDKSLRAWLRANRLDGFSQMVRSVDKADTEKQAILSRMKNNAMPAMMKAQQFVAELNTNGQSPKNIAMSEIQVSKTNFHECRLSKKQSNENVTAGEGEIIVKIDCFSFTANNITYALMGDRLGYWQFFPAHADNPKKWGIIPVWGFADVVDSKVEGIPVGERLYGYFPPADKVVMQPVKVRDDGFIDGISHRSHLPAGYNMYRRVMFEPNYTKDFDRERMLLTPLFLTSWCLWDALQMKDWYQAEQVIILSASSKTSIGLAYALSADPNAPKVVGVTSARNTELVAKTEQYDEIYTYDHLDKISNKSTVIVDMSGNGSVLAQLHQHLNDDMKHCINVGLTHWEDSKPQEGIIKDRSEFFFAPSHIMNRIKEWGPKVFGDKTNAFVMSTAQKTKSWLSFEELNGLEAMTKIYPDVCAGKIPANKGIIVKL